MIFRLAAARALRTNKRISAGDMLRELALSHKAGGNGNEVRVTLLPEVWRALAHSNIGAPADINILINNALLRDLQVEMADADAGHAMEVTA